MFDSGISANVLVNNLKNEVDIAIPISNESYVLWINALEQLLYTEYIKEQSKLAFDYSGDETDLSALTPSGENTIRFEDIYTVFADNTQLIKTTLTSGVIFPDSFYKTENKLGLNLTNSPKQIKVIYYVKPALKKCGTDGSIEDGNIMLPIEFIDLMSAKLRGEAYKVANEDAIAAKWINDYNVLLETFKVWIAGKRSEFGM